ncbi:MAG: transcription antitermination factor NusB [Candidatus Brocadia sp. UTAMX2]|jgi:transcription antitermination factor NusB|nr:MAG: transcription antitermination factor NusB [Candidatus Brocadia sp. UTAMX2]
MRNRTIARELAIQALYQLDLRGDEILGEIESFCKRSTEKHDVYQFAIAFTNGCRSHLKEIDEKISMVTEHWELRRMAIIDKNILRLGVYELLYRNDIPPKVSINEAIELAKKFSTKNSGTFVNGILDKIYTQGGDGKVKGEACPPPLQNVSEVQYGNADLHIHTNYSDGTMTPEEVVDDALRRGVSTISITDHDTVDGLVIALRYGQGKNIHIISGIEFSSYLSPSEVHILGYFIDVNNISLQKMIRQSRDDRVNRIHDMVDKLHALHVDIDAQEILALAGQGSPGRMHVAETLWKHGYCATIIESFTKYIGDNKPAYVPKKTLTSQQAIELIRDAGGVAVLAHPGLTQRDHIIGDLVQYGLQGIEVYYPSHSPQTVRKYLKVAKKYDLAVTGGSDFHGERRLDCPIAKITIPGDLVDKLRQRCPAR